jgi:hydroxyacylglutathione hydrolase
LCIERDNEAVKKCIEELKGGKCPVPSSIAKEKQTNVLLRSDCDSVKEALEMEGASAEEVFAELRIRKNAWG